jgi:LysM domain
MKHALKLAAYALCGALLGTLVQAADPETPRAGRSTSVPLAPDAPSSYVVQRGDTLWAISSKFLTQPWYWPEIWYLNPEIKNPHRIYPGDTLRLVYDAATGRPQIHVERGDTVRLSPKIQTTPLDQAIPAIPFEIVAAFMSKPSVISREDSKKLPYVVALPDNRVVAGMNDYLYVRGLGAAAPGTTLNVVHLGDQLRDPDGRGVLGYQGIYTGLARVERAAAGEGKNDLSKLVLVSSTRETTPGDRLIRETLDVPLDFVPHAPARPVNGRIIAVNDGVNIIGQYQVIAINRGRSDGLEPGDVLAIWQRGEKAPDRGGRTFGDDANRTFVPKVQLPEERAGTFMVFKTYAEMSYGLVMSAESAIHVGDTLRNP